MEDTNQPDTQADSVLDKSALLELYSVDEKLQEMYRDLRDGGPAVDDQAIQAYLSDHMDIQKHRDIAINVAKWQTWHRAFWLHALKRLEGPCGNGEAPPQ